MIPSGIEPATFRFVAQHLNHCATAVPTTTTSSKLILVIQLCVLRHYTMYVIQVNFLMDLYMIIDRL